MLTTELTLDITGEGSEVLIAELEELGCYGFLHREKCFKAYIEAPCWDDTKREHLDRWLSERGIPIRVAERKIAEENWNERWERSIQPVTAGPFFIAPPWTEESPEDEHRVVLTIDPKMSFGTGGHASTRLALRLMVGAVREGAHVLDAGTGTGVLAIGALRLGAASAVACDIDPWAQQNALENFRLNGVGDRVDFRPMAVEAVSEVGFDLIMANINRNTLLEGMSDLCAKRADEGQIILSGLLQSARTALLEGAARHGLSAAEEQSEEEWWAVRLEGR